MQNNSLPEVLNPKEKSVIMIVDDDIVNLKHGRDALSVQYDVITAPSAERMFAILEKQAPDLILLDIAMPGMDGYEALSRLKAHEREEIGKIPVVFLTARNDPSSEMRAFELGAIDFVNKPFFPAVLLKRIEMHLSVEKLVRQRTAEINRLRNGVVSVVAEMVEDRDNVTGGHIGRMQRYLELLLQAMMSQGCYAQEIAKWDMEVLLSASQLHDVGKVAISSAILNKPGLLTHDEYELIKQHVTKGEQIIDQVIHDTDQSDYLLYARVLVASHHERWDGTGYPRGLKGLDIPLQGRIMALVDVYDALVSQRPYKQPFSHAQAMDIIRSASGSHFEPDITKVFLSISAEIERLSSPEAFVRR
jgi:putative two-component system response regulator